MVYTGQPSSACSHCRRRKLRCDLRRDGCSQCRRAGLSCVGYRDPSLLRIKDESDSTKRKALRPRSQRINPSLQISLVERARAAFFSHYVHGFSKTYDVLERIGLLSALDAYLVASLDAVSLMFLSFQYDITTALKSAHQKYASALVLVKKAISAPAFLVSNSALLAVLLLDLFEKIATRRPASSGSWMSHVNGAMALVRLRDPSELKTYIGRRLSMRLFTNTVISCVAANASLPPALRDLHSELKPFVDRNDPKFQISSLVMKCADFRGVVLDGALSSSEILSMAKNLDKEFCTLARKLSMTWRIRTISLRKDSSQAFEQYYDIYPDFLATQTYNVIRMMRIQLNTFIRATYLDTASTCINVNSNTSNIVFASHIIDTMAREICASGPQFTLAANSSTRSINSNTAQKLHCYTLLFPFYVAAVSASAQSGIRDWVVEQLRAVATSCAIRNANVVAGLLERGEDTHPWAVYAMLGSYAFAA